MLEQIGNYCEVCRQAWRMISEGTGVKCIFVYVNNYFERTTVESAFWGGGGGGSGSSSEGTDNSCGGLTVVTARWSFPDSTGERCV